MWHVYQFRSDTELLYVGYSRHLKRRIGNHRREKPWWPEVTDIVTEEFDSEGGARQREKAIWASERPKYNRNNPFATPEEERRRDASYERSAESLERKRQQQREYDKTPARRARTRNRKRSDAYKAWHKDYMRAYNRTYRPRGWRQTGPGLFE